MKKEFDFWQDHSDTFLTMAYLYDRQEVIDKPDGYGSKTGDCGDTITIYLQIQNGCIKQLRFKLEGCLNTNACCNALAQLIEGKPLEKSWDITPSQLIDYLETLPSDHHHCAELTVGTYYLALASVKKE